MWNAPTCFATTRVWNYCVFVLVAIVTLWLFDRYITYNTVVVDDTINRPELWYAFFFSSLPRYVMYIYNEMLRWSLYHCSNWSSVQWHDDFESIWSRRLLPSCCFYFFHRWKRLPVNNPIGVINFGGGGGGVWLWFKFCCCCCCCFWKRGKETRWSIRPSFFNTLKKAQAQPRNAK